jgi:hypothetical protein
MKSCAVESASHRSLDVKNKLSVVGSGDYTLGIEALIKHEASENSLAVDHKSLFARQSDLAESEIAVKQVCFAVLCQLEGKIV